MLNTFLILGIDVSRKFQKCHDNFTTPTKCSMMKGNESVIKSSQVNAMRPDMV